MPIINSVIKGKQPVIDTLNVTPTTSAQQITAPQGTDGYSPVNVSAVTSSIDANIVAGNIKKDVQILGVTGSYEGTTPTGTVNITSNGTHNVSSYEYAEVLVPTTAPAYYIEKTKDANGVARNGSHLMDFSTFTDVGDYVFNYVYYQNTGITGAVDFGSLTTVSGTYACGQMFTGCTGLTSIDLSNLATVSGSSGCTQMFQGCTGLTNIDLSNLTTLSGGSGCQAMFYGCTGLTSIDLSSLITVGGSGTCQNMFQGCTRLTNIDLSNLATVSGSSGCQAMFYGCAGLTSIDLSSLITVSGQSACASMFYGCTNLASVNISKLAKLGTSNNISQMFRNCTSLTELRFSGLPYTATNINSAFSNTLQGVTGCTVHFPSDWQTTMSSWSNITNGLGGTNTTVLFDLPNVTTLDLSNITEINGVSAFYSFAQNNYFSNITSVDLSNLTTVSGYQACQYMFSGCTNITSIDLSSLTTVSGTAGCQNMFYGCAGIAGAVNLSSLTTVGQSGCNKMFQSCTGITSVNLSSLTKISESFACSNMFDGCTSLTSLSFPALTSTSFGSYTNQFNNMLRGVTGCTVRFPSNLQSVIGSWGDVTNGFGGTNTTVLYDLPATA